MGGSYVDVPPIHHYIPTPTLPTGSAQGSASSGSQSGGTWSSGWSPQPAGLHTFSSHPPPGQGPCEGKEHGPSRGIRRGPGRATEAGLPSTVAFPATGKAPSLESPDAQATPTDFFMYRRPQASPVPREGWAGQKKDFPLGVCPGSTSRCLPNGDLRPCPVPAPILAPNTQKQVLPPPKQLEADSGCGPQSPGPASLSRAGEGVASQGKGDMWVAPHPGGSPLRLSPQGPQPLFLLTDPEFFLLTSHPPRPRLSYVQEGKIL